MTDLRQTNFFPSPGIRPLFQQHLPNRVTAMGYAELETLGANYARSKLTLLTIRHVHLRQDRPMRHGLTSRTVIHLTISRRDREYGAVSG